MSFRIKFGKRFVILIVIAASVLVEACKINPVSVDFTPIILFKNIFTGIFLQAFPFLLAGSFLSALFSIFIPQRIIIEKLTLSPVRSAVAALVAAFVVPVCDCASVVVGASMSKKKVPAYSVVIYMLSSPIINPIVIASTFYAFPENPSMVIARIVCGIAIPLVLGFSAWFIFDSADTSILLKTESEEPHNHVGCSCHSCGTGHLHGDSFDHDRASHPMLRIINQLIEILSHTGNELYHVLPFFITGVIVSSVFQTMSAIEFIRMNNIPLLAQTGIMILASFFLSVCSTSDAFIARGFSAQYTAGPLLSFMTAGPMIDVKNAIAMSSYFKKKFIFFIMLSVWFSGFVASLLYSVIRGIL